MIKFLGHPSIVAIKKQMKKSSKTFIFQSASADKVNLTIKKLNTKKASKPDDILNKVIKEFGTFFQNSFQKTSTSKLP